MMRRNYKYSLDNTSRKFPCPNCKKIAFVKYINNETNLYLDDSIGRCDRESKCGYFKKPSGNTISTNCYTNCNTTVLQTTYHDQNLIQMFSNIKQQSNFITYLHKYFLQQEVLRVVEKYHIGTTNYWFGSTIFWQIDNFNNIRAGKIMQYNSISGKRVKQPFNHVSWMHKQLKLTNFLLQQCLYGLHLVNTISKSEIICITESEKTAIIMSLKFPSYLWLATGSKSGFKESLLQPIKNFKIIAYPDKTEFNKWNTTSILLNKKGYQIQCSKLLENEVLKNGGDLVDLLNST